MPDQLPIARRSFAPAQRQGDVLVTDFVEVDPQGLSDRELMVATLKAASATHHCVHNFQTQQQGVNRALTKGVGELSASMGIMRGEVDTLSKMHGAKSWEPNEKPIRPKGAGLKSRAGAVGMAALVAAMIALVANAGVYTFLKGQALAADASLTALAHK